MKIYDFSKLEGRIKEKLKYNNVFAEKIGTSAASLSSKLNNKTDFTASEISTAIEPDVLDLSVNEIGEYFFKVKLE